MPRVTRFVIKAAMKNAGSNFDKVMSGERRVEIMETWKRSTNFGLDTWDLTEKEANMIHALAGPYHEVMMKIYEIKHAKDK